MKKKEDWITQSPVDEVADQLLAEHGGDLDRVICNQVAVRLGLDRANQALISKFNDWLQRRKSEGAEHIKNAPEPLRGELDKLLETQAEKIKQVTLGLTGAQIVKLQEELEQERIRSRASIAAAQGEIGKLLERIEVCEEENERLRESNTDLQHEVSAKQMTVVQLTAQLDERQRLIERLMPGDRSAGGPDGTRPDPGSKSSTEPKGDVAAPSDASSSVDETLLKVEDAHGHSFDISKDVAG